jgi:oxygen-independent coproporphyrinogen III oxidase
MIKCITDNKPLPRYTSFPVYTDWNGAPSASDWVNQLNYSLKKDCFIEIYIHIPFCEKLCLYCACNRIITKNHEIELEYINAILKEWDTRYSSLYKPILKHLHLGGGTPTFLSPENLDYLLTEIKQRIKIAEEYEGSIEVDPRVTTIEHIKIFKKHKIDKVSLGVQSFNDDVQKAIGRIQSFELVKNLVTSLRNFKIKSINFDLIHGLPLQTKQTIKRTIEKAVSLKPDTIAFYQYAKVPWKSKAQLSLNKYKTPNVDDTKKLFAIGSKLLVNEQYMPLGFDHFVKKSDALYIAKEKGRLKRSFMGFSEVKTRVLVGLGVSAISYSGGGFIQNKKKYNEYMFLLKNCSFDIENGHVLNKLDKISEKIIQNLMCYGLAKIDKLIISLPKNISVEMIDKLIELKNEKYIEFYQGSIIINSKGKEYIRNICNILDYNSYK